MMPWPVDNDTKTVAIKNMACCHTGMRYHFHKYFELNGIQIIGSLEDADYVIVVACASVKAREERCINYINNVVKKKKKRISKIIVTGCLPKIERERLKGDKDIISLYEDDYLDEIFSAKTPLRSVGTYNLFAEAYRDLDLASYNNLYLPLGIWGDYPSGNKYKDALYKIVITMLKTFTRLKTHRNYKVYYIFPNFGCMGSCSYCAIRCAVGPVRSKTVNEVMQELHNGLSLGFKYFKVFSSDFSNYGIDINADFLNLLEKLTSINDNYQLEFTYINPNWIVEYFDKFLEILDRGKIKVINVPVQSGSQRILDMMRRKYKIEDVKKCLRILNFKHPYLEIITAVIIGFPTETEEDFAQTVDLLDKFDFAETHIYPYSDRPYTLSASFQEKVTLGIIRRRCRILKRKLRRHMLKVYMKYFIFDLMFEFGQGWKRVKHARETQKYKL